ncbi:MAG: hypothetical protein JXA13_15770 [Anaerolineales bacterium]|nr:hypothetical protein [Anaerolineales bacterium]
MQNKFAKTDCIKPICNSRQSARRFILGRRGLWPEMEALQLDPLNIVVRSQETVLWGRVVGVPAGTAA